MQLYRMNESALLDRLESPADVAPATYGYVASAVSPPLETPVLEQQQTKTDWFIMLDRRGAAIRVRQKLAAFIEGWEAPGMKDYDDL